MQVWRWLLPVLLGGCAPETFNYRGTTAPVLVTPEQVLEADELPRTARPLGRLYAGCEDQAEWTAFEARSLNNLDCSEARLRRVLSEAGAQRGGNVLSEVHCEGDETRLCSALLGRDLSLVTPSRDAAGASSSSAAGLLGNEIVIGLSPTVAEPKRDRVAFDGVRELPQLPLSHYPVAALQARCESGCSEPTLRDGLRMAAGQLGIADLVAVRCTSWEEGLRCIADAALSELPVQPGGAELKATARHSR